MICSETYGRAVLILTARDHSCTELQLKLIQKGFERAKIGPVIDELIEQNYLNDLRYAEAYLRSRAERGYGLQRIEQELRQRGVSESDVQRAKERCDICWLEVLEKVQQKKYAGQSASDKAAEAKQMRYYLQRGFNYDQIRQLWSGSRCSSDQQI